jgi:hypothetical protein
MNKFIRKNYYIIIQKFIGYYLYVYIAISYKYLADSILLFMYYQIRYKLCYL